MNCLINRSAIIFSVIECWSVDIYCSSLVNLSSDGGATTRFTLEPPLDASTLTEQPNTFFLVIVYLYCPLQSNDLFLTLISNSLLILLALSLSIVMKLSIACVLFLLASISQHLPIRCDLVCSTIG